MKEAVEHIKSYPEAYSPFSKHTRRCIVNKFPYSVIYLYDQRKEEVIIVAIAHTHRNPDYWKSRVRRD